MKKKLICLIMVFGLLFQTSCGKTENDNDRSNSEEPAATKQEADESTKTTADTDGISDEEEALDETASEPEDTALEVKNNGSEFVKVGDTVYFRVYDRSTVLLDSLFGEFPMADSAGGEGHMMALKDGAAEAEVAFLDDGCGDFFYYDGYFYGNRKEPKEDAPFEEWQYYPEDQLRDVAYRVKADGTEKEDLADGVITPLSLDGSIWCIRDLQEKKGSYHPIITVAKDGKDLFTIDVMNYPYPEFIAVAGDRIIATLTDDENGMEIWSLPEDSIDSITDGILIGTIPAGDEDSGFAVPEIEQFETDGENFYLSVVYYAGTGHFYQEGLFASGNANVEDSLSSKGKGDEENYYFCLKNGEMIPAPGKPGSADYCWEDGATRICFFDDEGVKNVTSVNAFDKEDMEREKEADFQLYVPYAAYIDGRLYYAANTNIHTPADDIGWRYSYHTVYTSYKTADPSDTEGKVLAETDYDNSAGFFVYLVDGQDKEPGIVVLQDYIMTDEEDGDYTIEPTTTASAFELSDDFHFYIPDFSNPDYEGDEPPEAEGSGGKKELFEYLSEYGNPIDPDVYSLEGSSYTPPYYDSDEMFDNTKDLAFTRMIVWFDAHGRISKIMPDFAG